MLGDSKAKVGVILGINWSRKVIERAKFSLYYLGWVKALSQSIGKYRVANLIGVSGEDSISYSGRVEKSNNL
jgi:hypothetical protein